MTPLESRVSALEQAVASLRLPGHCKMGRPVTRGHGTMACYMRGCRNDECRAAYTDYRRSKRSTL